MIKTEQLTINEKQFAKTYSSSGFMVERDGVQYSEAIDPADIPREYTETDEPIDSGEGSSEAEQKAEAWDALTEVNNNE